MPSSSRRYKKLSGNNVIKCDQPENDQCDKKDKIDSKIVAACDFQMKDIDKNYFSIQFEPGDPPFVIPDCPPTTITPIPLAVVPDNSGDNEIFDFTSPGPLRVLKDGFYNIAAFVNAVSSNITGSEPVAVTLEVRTNGVVLATQSVIFLENIGFSPGRCPLGINIAGEFPLKKGNKIEAFLYVSSSIPVHLDYTFLNGKLLVVANFTKARCQCCEC